MRDRLRGRRAAVAAAPLRLVICLVVGGLVLTGCTGSSKSDGTPGGGANAAPLQVLDILPPGENGTTDQRDLYDKLNRADPASGQVLFSLPDRFPNHNGGMVAFGPDGLLYVPDQGNSRVQKFTCEGKFVGKWGEHGTEPGRFGGNGDGAATTQGNAAGQAESSVPAQYRRQVAKYFQQLNEQLGDQQ